ncbi:MAG: peptidyl-prolyl cis-trans isomerase [Mediterranea massiliensis]|nr:peptidyl-prolyl cis-trans isomerase [Mediterranea massiliensis]
MRVTIHKNWLWMFFFLFALSCAEKHDHKGKRPLVELDGNFLYKEDLQNMLPLNVTLQDSADLVSRYIRNWAEDVLLYDKAKRNIPNSDEIERLVSNYRKVLILHAYQQEMIHQKLSAEITEDELQQFYDENLPLFKLEHPLMKGLFIKVPLKAPQLSNVRRWYKSDDQEQIEKLEKYSFQYALKYEYFHDKWLPVSNILDWIPMTVEELNAKLAKERSIEIKDDEFYYFLCVSDYRDKGEQEPFEYARSQVKDVLQSIRQTDFMNDVRKELYEQAREENRIIYH